VRERSKFRDSDKERQIIDIMEDIKAELEEVGR